MSNEFDTSKVMTPEFIATVAMIMKQMESNTRTKAPTLGTGSTHNLVHGTGSFLGSVNVGIEPEVISLMMHWVGLGEHLPIVGTRNREVLLPFITGVEPTSTSEPTTECADCIAGETEACIQHFPMGRVCRETQTMTPDRIIERLNRGDIDLTLLNNVLGSDSPWHPGDSFTNQADLMQVATAWALLFELPPLFMHALAPMMYDGNPTNNLGDGYREFRGLDILINTGFVDAITNTTCPSLDSDIKSMNFGNVETTQNPTFYELLEMLEFYIYHTATRQRLSPFTAAVVMRPELWQVVSAIMPVQRLVASLMNNTFTGYNLNVDLGTVVSERDKFRADGMIPLNGRMYPVITDDGIFEHNNANSANCALGEYASDVYFVPLTFLGNRPALRIEYKDFRYMANEVAATDDLIGGFYRPSADGRFAFTWVKEGWCFKVQAKMEPRLLLKTPQLAGRIENVKYVPLQHLKSPDPDSPYFRKGGSSVRAPRSYYYNSTQGR